MALFSFQSPRITILKGFTLLETLVAISILLTAIVGPLNLATQSIQAQSFSKNNLLAASFAQEGVELIRAYRDRNVLGSDTTHWLDGMGDCITNAPCGIDADDAIVSLTPGPGDTLQIPTCSTINECKLYEEPSSGLYLHYAGGAGNSYTGFKREIIMTPLGFPNDYETEVRVVIRWKERSGDRSFELRSHIFNY